ncbi:MAG: amidohydrolase [Planctomycetes bacterium]|nr:amidohydrolase [Planctomycetota bacterium]
MRLLLLLALLAGACAGPPPGERNPSPIEVADLVLRNGRIWTVDPARPEAEAVAVLGDRILAAGSDAEILRLAGPRTRVLDLRGRRVLPGFHDSHVHFVAGGESLSEVDLKDAEDEEDFGERLREFSAGLHPGAWILGGNWDHDRWPGGRLPTAALVDRFVPDRPVWVTRYDGHMSVANGAALRAAGVAASTPDPPGGVIVRKEGSQEPAGVLKDAAQALVERVVPAATPGEIEAAVEAAATHAARLGVTAVQDMGTSEEEFRAMEAVRARGRLTVRVLAYLPFSRWRALAAAPPRQGDPQLRVAGIKAYADGSLGSTTALFFEPYADAPAERGLRVTEPDAMRALAVEGDGAGLRLAIHAIGDRGISEILDDFEAATARNGARDRRFRIEHAQHVAPKDFERFARLGVIASMQPYHAIDDGRWAEKRIGKERCKTTYAFRTFLDRGVRLAIGADWTVAPLDPIAGLDAAVNRRTLDGAHPAGWFPEQRISVREAIEAYTMGSAHAAFEESRLGSISKGKLADLVVLSEDLLSIPPGEIPKAKVLLTLVGGKVVHRDEAFRE